MAAPKKVRQNAALAERLIAEQATKTPVGDPAPAPIVPAPELSVVTDRPIVPDPPPQPAAQPINPYAIDPTAVVNQPAAPVRDDWEHKYSVLQGMFEKSRSENAVKIQQLENQIGVMTTLAQPAPTYQDTFHPNAHLPNPAPAAPVNYGFTDEQVEEMGGQEFLDNIAKVSTNAAAGEIASLRNELGSLKETQSDTLDDLFYNRMSELSPAWREINKDDRFNVWLKEGDGLSGIARSNFLTNAYDNRDAETAARYFNQFAALLPSPHDLDPNLHQDIVPDPAGGSGPPRATGGKPMYTPAGISAFFKDKGLGKFKGREAEADAIEKDIFAAQKEGRIMQTRGRPPA
jgi:hypothetical protein